MDTKKLLLPGQQLPPQMQGPVMVTAQLGMSNAMVGCSMFCVNCWPKQVPSFFIWQGFSLCHQCVTPLRKKRDHMVADLPHFCAISKRDPEEVWGKEDAPTETPAE